jgi:hypothetical protein
LATIAPSSSLFSFSEYRVSFSTYAKQKKGKDKKKRIRAGREQDSCAAGYQKVCIQCFFGGGNLLFLLRGVLDDLNKKKNKKKQKEKEKPKKRESVRDSSQIPPNPSGLCWVTPLV